MNVRITRKSGLVDELKKCRMVIQDGEICLSQVVDGLHGIEETTMNCSTDWIVQLEVVPNGKDFSK